jgi:hypothetical protein
MRAMPQRRRSRRKEGRQMSRQLDMFVKIHRQEKSTYWNAFYGPTLERLAKEKKEQEIARNEASRPISILIKHAE